MAGTMRCTGLAVALLALGAQPALAQIERYDPNSGKYVTSDPFAQPDPPAPSPYRINPRIATGVSPQSAPGARAAPGATVAGAGGSAPAAAASASPQQFVPMDGMAMYDGNAGPADPFAKPDWWPQ